MKRLLLLPAALAAACGSSSSTRPWQQLANLCAVPQSSGDKQGTAADEKTFLKAWSDDTYLWYRDLPNPDPNQYATALDYFNVLKSSATTASGNPRDKFHFTYPTTVWNQLSQSGVEAGYGMEVVLISRSPPREAVVAYTEAGTPAADPANFVQRGTHILSIDGVDLVNGSDVTTLNNGLFPATVGEKHAFVFQDPAPSTTQHNVTLTSVAVTHAPVPIAGALSATPAVGYMLFNDHLATAEKGLVDAINTLKAANVTDLVLDIRYNGGGFLDIASELAYMIAGPGPTTGQTFERTVFNDKHSTNDPITGRPLQPTPFLSQAVGLSVPQGQALPNLGLKQVFVLTGSRTCSASESVINSLRGVGVNVIQIGSTTCGKPYGFYPQDNCGTTYFSIQFQGVNAKGFGDYSDGFVPARTDLPNGIAGCQVADDFHHALGDPAEARLAAALQYRSTPGSCPAPTFARSNALTTPGAPEGVMVKPPWRENRLYWRN